MSTNSDKLSILFVCTGNICRSPLAEALFAEYALEQGAAGRLEIGSAGTHAWGGNPATWEAQEAGRQWGLDLTPHRARAINAYLLEETDLLLVATQNHYDWLCREFPEHKNKVYLALLFPQRLANQSPAETDIPDPMGESVAYYLSVLEMLKPVLARILAGALAMRRG